MCGAGSTSTLHKIGTGDMIIIDQTEYDLRQIVVVLIPFFSDNHNSAHGLGLRFAPYDC